MRVRSDSPRSVVQEFPGGIEVVLHRQLCQLALKPGARFEPGFAPGDALRSVIVRRERAKLVQIRNGSVWVEWH